LQASPTFSTKCGTKDYHKWWVDMDLKGGGMVPVKAPSWYLTANNKETKKKNCHDDLYTGQHLNCVPPAPSHSQNMVGSFLSHPKFLRYEGVIPCQVNQ
jgi:hypothetical protein